MRAPQAPPPTIGIGPRPLRESVVPRSLALAEHLEIGEDTLRIRRLRSAAAADNHERCHEHDEKPPHPCEERNCVRRFYRSAGRMLLPDMASLVPPGQFGRRFPAAAVAGVWLYHGLWCKLLRQCPDQSRIVAAVPGLGGRRADAVLLGLGVVETALAVWVLSGARPRLAAGVGTALVAGMNAGGLAFGRRHIPAPRALVLENLGFLGLAWLAAESDRAGARA
jgi:hypothetical protein